jgi:hypothetical protein
MNMKTSLITKWFPLLILVLLSSLINAQITERQRPAQWDNLVFGGRFMDRFLPMPVQGPLTSDTWGAKEVVPRYIENGLEDNDWSYWGGNATLGEDGKYHLFACRWPEDAEKGHMAWPDSEVVHAVAENSFGPYRVVSTIGKGHNPELFQLKDGRFIVYVYKGYYIADTLEGPWEYKRFKFDRRDRKVHDGLSNLTFAQREDGSYLMVCRGGGVWFSETGESPYFQVSGESVYPPVEGRFEDPVIWKTHVQYHLIVNDWYGRIAYYLRSKDGINWKVDPGEAYMPGIAVYEDGTKVDWFKYERIKVLQDEYGRATQAHFAVIDTIKWDDLSNDNHSSKHICIPLTVGRLMTVLNKDEITAATKEIKVKIEAENGFNPHKDMDLESLTFGAPETVNFGGGCKVLSTEEDGKDLIITFEGKGNGFDETNFAAKLLGKTKEGQLLYAYARLPWVNYLEPALSARAPILKSNQSGSIIQVEVQNFGQVASQAGEVLVEVLKEDEVLISQKISVKALNSFEKQALQCQSEQQLKLHEAYSVKVQLIIDEERRLLFEGKSIVEKLR